MRRLIGRGRPNSRGQLRRLIAAALVRAADGSVRRVALHAAAVSVRLKLNHNAELRNTKEHIVSVVQTAPSPAEQFEDPSRPAEFV